jgi:PAS domain S-box-containing protein
MSRSVQHEAPFLSLKGEMAQRLRDFDWGSTSLGPIAQWPQSLKTAAGMVLVSPVPIVMLWGQDGIMIYNDAYSAFAGGRHPKLLGSKVREGWPEVADFSDHVMKVGLSGGTLAYRDQELTLYRSGVAEQVWLNLDYSPILDESGKPAGVMAIVVETTERVRAEAALQHSWHHSRDLLGIAGTDGIISAANPALTEILGYTSDEVIGRSYLDFVFPEDVHLAADAWQTQLSGHILTDFQIRLRRKDGSARWISWNSRTEGDLFYGYGRDITAAKAQEQALADAERALRQAQKMEAIGQLTGGIAHDFNNVLQSLTGCLDLIRRRPDEPERVHRWAEAGLKAAQRGANLTAQLLAFSRSQKLELQQINLSALLSGMRELLGRTLGPTIRIQIDLGAHSAGVLCDQTQLEMAVLNLAINARDAMPNGGELRISTYERTITHDPELPTGRYIELAVSDTGTGMLAEVAAKAFDPFFTTKGVGKGTGLGLSQVYGMARQAGGVARIQSMPQQGTTVWLLLPSLDKIRSAAAEREESDSPIARMTATVLVVDDDADVRQFLVEALQTFGYHVLEAEDGYAALSLLAKSSPDLVIVDYAMPGLTGVETVRELRLKRPDLPILFVSGYAETAAMEKVVDEKIAVLRKPFQISKLQEIMSRLFQKSQE